MITYKMVKLYYLITYTINQLGILNSLNQTKLDGGSIYASNYDLELENILFLNMKLRDKDL